MPVLVRASEPGVPLPSTAEERTRIEAQLLTSGAVLLRGFAVTSRIHFSAFAESFGRPLVSYEFGSTPRTALGAGVYTSTEYPAHRSIPLHNEQSYTRNWPMKLWFHCAHAALSGGATPIADSRRIYARIPARIRERFAQLRQVMGDINGRPPADGDTLNFFGRRFVVGDQPGMRTEPRKEDVDEIAAVVRADQPRARPTRTNGSQ